MKKELLHSLLLAVFFLLVGCREYTTVTLKLSTSDERYPVKNATVRLSNHDEKPRHIYEQIVSGDKAIFEKIPHGDYTLTILYFGEEVYKSEDIALARKFFKDSIALPFCPDGQAGGLIFYDKGSISKGWRYLEAAPEYAEFYAEWGTRSYDVVGTKKDLGTGKDNTKLIMEALSLRNEKNKAAQRCVDLTINGFSDWFLPSLEELNLMYTNLKTKELGGFVDDIYWSSTQDYSNDAKIQNFSNGIQYEYGYKDNSYRVRAIRAY